MVARPSPNKRHNRSLRFNFLITLTQSKDKVMSWERTFSLLKEWLESKGESNFILVKTTELHQDGTPHWHIILIIKKGISKNVVIKELRSAFRPTFEGRRVNIQGIKNIKAAIIYVLKDVNNSNCKDLFLWNISFIRLIKMSHKGSITHIYLRILLMEKDTTFKDWKEQDNINRYASYKNMAMVKRIWDDVQSDKQLSLKYIIDTLKTLKVTEAPTLTQSVSPTGIILLLKLFVNLFTPHAWKQTNILLTGAPNVGKTRLFTRLQHALKTTFYWGSSRPGDFTGLRDNHSLMIIDDQMTFKHEWPTPILLKLLGSEGFTADVKLRHMVKVKAGLPVVVISNYDSLFSSSEALDARVFRIKLRDKTNWLEIRDDQLFKLSTYLFNTVQTIREEDLKTIKYSKGIPCLLNSPSVKSLILDLFTALNGVPLKDFQSLNHYECPYIDKNDEGRKVIHFERVSVLPFKPFLE